MSENRTFFQLQAKVRHFEGLKDLQGQRYSYPAGLVTNGMTERQQISFGQNKIFPAGRTKKEIRFPA